jgi:hypothetical protein
MRRFLSNLLRDFRTTRSAPAGRRAPRRTTLQLEGLEDRLAMSALTTTGSTFLTAPSTGSTALISSLTSSTGSQPLESTTIGAQPSITITSNGAGQGEVIANGRNIGQFNIALNNAVFINLESFESVTIDDSHGLPFASGTTVTLQGNQVFGCSLTLSGSGVVSGDEQFVAADFNGNESLSVGGAKLLFNNAVVPSVTDTMQITGTFDVQTSGNFVQLLSSDSHTQILENLAAGTALGTLSYANKSQIVLEEDLGNAAVYLFTSQAETLESSFVVEMHGINDSTFIRSTPSTVSTSVWTTLGPVANNATVGVGGNLGPVDINGNASTLVNITDGSTTQGIKANVLVNGASELYMFNGGNVLTPENVTVTDFSISGTGLFGNNNVTLNYGGVGHVDIVTGTLADQYTIEGSQPDAVFASKIDITSDSQVSFRADVFVNSASHLNLGLYNGVSQFPVPAQLFVHPSSDGTAVLPGTLPSGVVDVFFGGQATSQITYKGFTTVAEIFPIRPFQTFQMV